MYLQGTDEYKHHLAVYGPQDKFGYKDFIPKFKAEKFDPAAWARLFKEAGAKYVVPVFEHHDGFAMYDCGLSDWTAAKMGPHRDLFGDLAKAVRQEGLHLGASSHRVEHNFFLGRRSRNSFRRKRPRIRRFLRACSQMARGQKRDAPFQRLHVRLSTRGQTTGWPAPPKLSRSIIRKSCISIGGSVSRPCVLR